MMIACITVVSVDRLNRAKQIQVKNEQFFTSLPQCYKALLRDWTCPLLLVLSSLTLVHLVPHRRQSQKPTRRLLGQLRVQGLNPVQQQCQQPDRNHTEHYQHSPRVRHLAYRSVHGQLSVTNSDTAIANRHVFYSQRFIHSVLCNTIPDTVHAPVRT